jgi:hypothetical protein
MSEDHVRNANRIAAQRETTRRHIEGELLARLEVARANYEKLKHKMASMQAIAADTLGTDDGAVSLRKACALVRPLNHALLVYVRALKAFKAFSVNGRIPTDFE